MCCFTFYVTSPISTFCVTSPFMWTCTGPNSLCCYCQVYHYMRVWFIRIMIPWHLHVHKSSTWFTHLLMLIHPAKELPPDSYSVVYVTYSTLQSANYEYLCLASKATRLHFCRVLVLIEVSTVRTTHLYIALYTSCIQHWCALGAAACQYLCW